MAYAALDRISAEDISAVGVASDEAERLRVALREALREYGSSGPEAWREISKRLLNPSLPFALHQMLYYGCYKDYDSDTPPAWIPNPEEAVSTNIGRILETRGKELLGSAYINPIASFSDFQKFSVSNPEEYWKMIFEEMGIKFSVQPSCILRESDSYPGGQWLPGAYLNSAENCLILNGKRDADDVVVIWRDEGCDDVPVNRMTLEELRTEVS